MAVRRHCIQEKCLTLTISSCLSNDWRYIRALDEARAGARAGPARAICL